MADFRIRLLSLAAVATAFAGVSYGQSTVACTFASTGNPTLRAESQTELVADTLSPCTTTGGTTTGSVVLTMSLPVTSKAGTFVSSLGSTTGNSDAVLLINGTGGGAYYGTVSGTQVSFSNVTFPASFTLQTSNIRVNASTGGAPQVTGTILVSYATVAGGASNNIVSTAQNVGFILSTLGAPSLLVGGSSAASPATFANYTTCAGNVVSLATGGNATANQSFTVLIKELVAGAFKTQTQEGGSYPIGSATALQGGSAQAVGIGTATSATQISLVFANVPASATIYVPQSVTVNGTTIAIANSTPVTTPANLVTTLPSPVAFTPVSGTVTVVYTTIAAASTGASTFNIPTFVIFAANSAPAQTAITVNESYAPASALTAPAAAVPSFAVSTATPLSASVISVCQTSLLFPFVTNTQGFDTGLVIANTSTDNLGSTTRPSSAASQAGTCTLSFYGTGLPTPSTGVNDPLGNSPTAGTHAFLLSAVAPGFQGYVIASCPFLYAHGYAFLAYNLTQSNGAVQGYLAEVLTPGRAGVGTGSEAVTF
jgi:hypothetical protein